MPARKKEELNVDNLNDVIFLSKKILKIIYILIVIAGLYIGIRLAKELEITNIFIMILKTISPLFIGLFVAWLFDPFVKWMKRKGINRPIGTVITYFLIVLVLTILISSIVPMLSTQITELIGQIPEVANTIKGWINDILYRIPNNGIDIEAMKVSTFKILEDVANGITQMLPATMVEIVKSLFSGAGTFLIGLIIGFYLLLSFDNAGDLFITWFPKNIRNDVKHLFNEINALLRRFIKGACLDCFVVFVATSFGLWIVGMNAPILFGLFCGLTNVIPYAGPYIGGIPAVIVGFASGPVTGILTLVVIVLVQTIEGNLFQPLIMSKSTKLHPVTIIIGLLVFGYFFGIIGMAISTPLIGVLKTIYQFLNKKYNLFKLED